MDRLDTSASKYAKQADGVCKATSCGELDVVTARSVASMQCHSERQVVTSSTMAEIKSSPGHGQFERTTSLSFCAAPSNMEDAFDETTGFSFTSSLDRDTTTVLPYLFKSMTSEASPQSVDVPLVWPNYSLRSPPSTNVVASRSSQMDGVTSSISMRATPITTTTNSSAAHSNEYRYILNATTSAAVHLNEEMVTYLNQGQAYELRCLRLVPGGSVHSAALPNDQYRSTVCVAFHGARQAFAESELWKDWRAENTGMRILDVDFALSRNVTNVEFDSRTGRHVRFTWSHTKATTITLKINCISTDFAERKRGGEKGVSFRIQVDTYADPVTKYLHSSQAQIKVFKLKGAERKNKTDRDRAGKRGPTERFQPSYETTILTDCPGPAGLFVDHGNLQAPPLLTIGDKPSTAEMDSEPVVDIVTTAGSTPRPIQNAEVSNPVTTVTEISLASSPSPTTSSVFTDHDVLLRSATAEEVTDWLRKHRFNAAAFATFNGEDMLRLSKPDLMSICGCSIGIRLFNILHGTPLAARLVMYIRLPQAANYKAIYLHSFAVTELKHRLCLLMGKPNDTIVSILWDNTATSNICIEFTDELLLNMENELSFAARFEQFRTAADARTPVSSHTGVAPLKWTVYLKKQSSSIPAHSFAQTHKVPKYAGNSA